MLLIVALLGLTGRSSASSAPSRPTPTPPVGTGREFGRIRTGELHLPTWSVRRLALALAALRGLSPPVPEELLDRVALSLLAQWAHETNRGISEFNFNLGGWTARRGDDFFSASDVLTPGKPVFRWTSYLDLPTAVEDQVKRLAFGFPTAWALLLANPESSAWVEELGRKGYYSAKPADYARAWAMHRLELSRIGGNARTAEIDGRKYFVIKRGGGVFEVFSATDPEARMVFHIDTGPIEQGARGAQVDQDMRRFPEDLFK